MHRMFRATLLILVLLFESLGTALALPPPAMPVEQVMAMPCHDDADAQAAMPCCDDAGDCRCSSHCFGAGSALAPALSSLRESLLPIAMSATGGPAPLSAHLLLLLRPPASAES